MGKGTGMARAWGWHKDVNDIGMRMAQGWGWHGDGGGMGKGTGMGTAGDRDGRGWGWHGTGVARGWECHGMGMAGDGDGRGWHKRVSGTGTGLAWPRAQQSGAQASAGSWHSGHKPGDAPARALSPAPSLPAGEELLEEGRLAALGQDFHLPGRGQGRGDVTHASPRGTPRRPHPPASGASGPSGR